MGVAENKALVRRFLDEGFEKGDMAVVDELIAEDAVDHEAPPGLPPGREGIKMFLNMFRSAFSDLRFEIEDEIGEGDLVAQRITIHATHTGDFMGIPATGKRIAVSGIDITRVENGKLVEHWGATDNLGMMQQLGVIPTPGQQ